METAALLKLQHGNLDLQAGVEKQWDPVDLTLERGDQTPDELDIALTFPRQESPPPPAHVGPAGPEKCDSEEITTYISENMTVTSADEEKLLLLSRNTDLRQINKELMKLNQEWGAIYQATQLEMQHNVGSLQEEVAALKMQVQKLSAKLEHEQRKREYYQHILFQEMKWSQAWQEYLWRLDGQTMHSREMRPRSASPKRASDASADLWGGERRLAPGPVVANLCTPPKESKVSAPLPWEEFTAPLHALPRKGSVTNRPHEEASPRLCGGSSTEDKDHQRFAQQSRGSTSDAEKKVADLKEQLVALKYQTEIYKAEYMTEQQDRQRIKAENAKLQNKEEEMRQQMALLEEQLKIFEDDFWRERSDKQILQRLLKRKPDTKEKPAIPEHRCSGGEKPVAPTSPSPWRGCCGCSCHGGTHGRRSAISTPRPPKPGPRPPTSSGTAKG
ncbi:uncharacterized protein LOC133371116 [Rhineura floridana]|uniref:uncharacterized protein LOC133371116 n=1 Tax=Rhineura floridana TaxID=261503 RepID=UPI002AC86295|nr:uncharacterized protein LOC133371116 [Rhineura floridana]